MPASLLNAGPTYRVLGEIAGKFIYFDNGSMTSRALSAMRPKRVFGLKHGSGEFCRVGVCGRRACFLRARGGSLVGF